MDERRGAPHEGGNAGAKRRPLAYLITFSTYGSWLHGDDRGSAGRERSGAHEEYHQPGSRLGGAELQLLRQPPFRLEPEQRKVVDRTIREVARYRGWDLQALAVCGLHVHCVVDADAPPEKVMTDFKAWATRRLREAGLVGPDRKVWARHGSTRYLWNLRAVEYARDYVDRHAARGDAVAPTVIAKHPTKPQP